MPPRNIFDIPWPMQGLVENAAYVANPEGSTLECLNVRPFDQFERRLRGGQRTGIKKSVDDAVSAGTFIQRIDTATEAVAVVEGAGASDKLSDPSTFVADEDGSQVAWHPSGDYFAVATGTDKRVYVYPINAAGVIGSPSIIPTGSFGSNATDGVAFSPGGDWLIAADENEIRSFAFNASTGVVTTSDTDSANTSHPDNFADSGRIYMHPNGTWVSTSTGTLHEFSEVTGMFGSKVNIPNRTIQSEPVAWHPDGDWVLFGSSTAFYLAARSFNESTGALGSETAAPTTGLSSISSLDTLVMFSPDGLYAVVSYSDTSGNDYITTHPFSKTTGFGLGTESSDMGQTVRSGSFTSDGTILIAALNGSPGFVMFQWNAGLGSQLAAPGTAASGDGLDAVLSPADLFLAVGIQSTAATPPMELWRWTAGGTNPSARKKRLVVVAGGDVYRSVTPPTAFALATGGNDALRADVRVGSSTAFQKMFFADGLSANYSYLDYADGEVKDWATDVTAGSLPEGSTDTTLGCDIITTYRGRIVLSGLIEDPQNWFMSRAGDPFDWDYAPSTTTALDPVAGNNSNAGQLGDVITALAPFQDDVMIMGGPTSLWIMRGDPAAGGAIDNISRQIGIVQPTAWTWDAVGNLYFFGQDGLYRLAPEGGLPQPISRGRLDKTFEDTDLSTNYIFLTYDRQWKGVHIFISPTSEPSSSSSHYFWDERTDSFWRDEYPTNIGPTAVALFEADDPDARAVLLGGYDGFLRQFSDTAKDDDGTAIVSRCWMSPVTPGSIYASARYDDIQVVLAKDSDSVTAKLYTGASPEDAAANIDAGNDPRAVRSLIGGRNQPMRQRISQNTLIPVLEQTGTGSWAFEQGGGIYQLLNRMRYRRVT